MCSLCFPSLSVFHQSDNLCVCVGGVCVCAHLHACAFVRDRVLCEYDGVRMSKINVYLCSIFLKLMEGFINIKYN